MNLLLKRDVAASGKTVLNTKMKGAFSSLMKTATKTGEAMKTNASKMQSSNFVKATKEKASYVFIGQFDTVHVLIRFID